MKDSITAEMKIKSRIESFSLSVKSNCTKTNKKTTPAIILKESIMKTSIFLTGLNILLERSNTANKRMYRVNGDSMNLPLRIVFKIPRRIIVPITIHIIYSRGWAMTPPRLGINTCIMTIKIIERKANR